MKVPPGKPGADAPPSYASKDRSFTRRTVAGAAGGMKGVDYEDPGRLGGRPLPNAVSPRGPERSSAGTEPGLSSSTPNDLRGLGSPKEEAEMVLDDEDAISRDAKARQRSRHLVARDRFTIDKDAPERQRLIRWDLLESEEDEEEADEAAEIDLEAVVEALAVANEAARPRKEPSGRRYPRPARPGEPGLFDPAEAMARLGSPLAYAQHALLLSEAFRQSTGADRSEVIAYLAELFVAVPDLGFGRSALRELGPSTGIVEIYPLEVLAHVLEHHKGFLRKVAFGSIFTSLPRGEPLRLEPFRARELSAPPDWLVRGFAISGGARPGYRFEPGREDGVYRLVLGAVGDYELLVSARAPSGTLIERFEVEVLGSGPIPRHPEPLPRDEAKLASWPRPTVPTSFEDEAEADAEAPALWSPGERIARTELDALRGPKGESETFSFRGAVYDAEGPRSSEAVRAAEAAVRARAGLEDLDEPPDPWAGLLEDARRKPRPSPSDVEPVAPEAKAAQREGPLVREDPVEGGLSEITLPDLPAFFPSDGEASGAAGEDTDDLERGGVALAPNDATDAARASVQASPSADATPNDAPKARAAPQRASPLEDATPDDAAEARAAPVGAGPGSERSPAGGARWPPLLVPTAATPFEPRVAPPKAPTSIQRGSEAQEPGGAPLFAVVPRAPLDHPFSPSPDEPGSRGFSDRSENEPGDA